MGNTKRWRRLVAGLAIAGLLGAACGGDGGDGGGDAGGGGDFPEGSTMAELAAQGEIVIGVKFDVPPFGFENPQTGEVEGFDVDLGKIIAEELGVEPRFIEAISDNRIPFLQDGTADLILSTMTITTDRDAEIDFSRPYYIARGRVLVPEDSDISEVGDLAGRRVCTALGSTYEENLSKEVPDARLELVDSYSECLELLQNGAVDAISTDDVILTGMIIQAGEDFPMKLVGDPISIEPYGAGVQDGDTEFADFVSGVIEQTFADGTWDELYERWVGQYTGEEPEHPQEYTLQEALEMRPCVEFC